MCSFMEMELVSNEQIFLSEVFSHHQKKITSFITENYGKKLEHLGFS